MVYAQTDFEKGVQLLEKGEVEEAKTVFESLLKEDPQNVEIHFQLGKSYFFLEDYDTSVDFLEQAVALEEDNSLYHQWLGRAIGLKAQNGSKLKLIFRAKKAKGEFEKAVQLDPQNIDARFDLMQYYLQAPGLAGGSKEKATEQARGILKLDRTKGRLAFGLIYEQSENYEEAEQRYVEATRLDSLNTDIYYYLGFFYQRQESYNKAIQIFEKILDVDPEETGALYQVGRSCVMKQDELDRAEQCFQRYLEVEPKPGNPGWASAHWRLGMVYDLQGDKESALAEWKRALALNPDHKQARDAVKKAEK